MAHIEAKDRLIVALDVPTVREAEKLVKKLDSLVSLFKVGIILQATDGGLGFVRRLIKKGKKVFLDLKYFDVEDTVKGAVEVVAKCSVRKLVLFRSKKAFKSGCDGIVASGREAKLIRKEIGNGLLIVTPGIRPEGTSMNNHKRSTTPMKAIQAGADYLVVGRPIIKAKNPRKAAESIIKDMEIGFQSRK